MIVPVTNENEIKWAELCVDLWPHCTIDEMLAERNANKSEDEFLYSLNNEFIAFLNISLRHEYVEGTDSSPVGYVEGIYVKPEHQGKGIAKELIEFAKKWARENDCKELASDCLLENEDSRKFHNKVGFKEANTVVCFTMDV